VVDEASNNLKKILVDAMVLYGGLIQETITSKLITFGVDDISVFQGVRTWVIVQLKNQNAPFMIGVYCMNHHTNLAMQTFSKLAIVRKIEDLLQRYVYFSHSPKGTQKSVKLADIVETERQPILRNIETQWIPMLLLTKKVLSEYRTLVLNMHQDSTIIPQVAHNLQLMCDLEVMLGLFCLMPNA
jgi:hypothetical protein